MEQCAREGATNAVAAGILACRRAVLPSPADRTRVRAKAVSNNRAAGTPAHSIRVARCRPLRQARMPDATRHRLRRDIAPEARAPQILHPSRYAFPRVNTKNFPVRFSRPAGI